ncbi:MAG: hypothetical protein ACXVAY_01410 [Mucilaginibacter sp.]
MIYKVLVFNYSKNSRSTALIVILPAYATVSDGDQVTVSVFDLTGCLFLCCPI